MTSRSGSRPRLPTPTPGVRAALLAAAAALLAVAVLGLVVHFRASGHWWSLGVSAFAPYLMAGAPVGLVLFSVARLRSGILLSVAVLAVCVSTQVPLYVAQTPSAHAVRVAELTANLHAGEADASDVVRAVRDHSVDLYAAQELTWDERNKLRQAGLDRLLRFHVLDPRGDASGTGLWSRYPIDSPVQRHDFNFALVTGQVSVPGASGPIAVAALHMAGPVPDAVPWTRDIGHLPVVLRELVGKRTVLVAGDFNATSDVVQFRQLLTHGYEDAADQAGVGLTPTYPTNRWYPPLIGIDHVLTRRAVATAADTIQISDSDHRALLITVAVPRAA